MQIKEPVVIAPFGHPYPVGLDIQRSVVPQPPSAGQISQDLEGDRLGDVNYCLVEEPDKTGTRSCSEPLLLPGGSQPTMTTSRINPRIPLCKPYTTWAGFPRPGY